MKTILKSTAAIVPLCLGLAALSGCTTSGPVKSARYIESGKKLLAKGDVNRAILEFRNAVKADPKNADAFYELGVTFLAARDYPNAAACLNRAVELNPKHAAAQLRLAQMMAAAGTPELLKNSEQKLDAILKDAPRNPEALYALGLTEMRLGDSAAGIRNLEQSLAVAPQDLVVAYSLAAAKVQEKDIAGARQVLLDAVKNSPKSADALVLLGRFYASQNDLPNAEDAFRRGVAVDPKDGAALFNLALLQNETGRKSDAEQNFKRLSTFTDENMRGLYGLFLFQEGRRPEAVREFERLAATYPADRSLRTRLIAAYEAVNRTPDALKVLNAALKSNPKDLDALLQRGELELNSSDLAAAEGDLNRVLHFKPESAEAHYGLARLSLRRGAVLMYRQELGEVLKRNEGLLPARIELIKSLLADDNAQSVKAATAILESTPPQQKDLVAVVEQRNWVLLKTNDNAGARKGVDRGLALERTPDLLLQDALIKFNSQRFAEARASLKEALAKAPGDVRILRAVVGSYAAQKQVPAAVAEIRSHAAAHPQSAEVQYFLGNLLLETGDQKNAQQAFAKAVTLNPSNTSASIELARMDLKQANWTDARQQLNGILSTEGQNPQARMWLGMLEEVQGNHNAALEQFRKVIENDPRNYVAYNNTAFILSSDDKRLDEALKYAQKAQELAPDNASVHDTLGWILYRKGLYQNAVTLLQSAAAGGNTRLQYHLAMAYLKSGQESRGRTVLQAALRKDPNLPEARMAQQLFETAPAPVH